MQIAKIVKSPSSPSNQQRPPRFCKSTAYKRACKTACQHLYNSACQPMRHRPYSPCNKTLFLQKTVKRAPQIASNLLVRRKTLECSAQKFGRKRAQFRYEIRLMRIRGDNQPIKRFEKIFFWFCKRDTPFQKASRQKEKTLPSKIFSLHSLKRRQRPHASKTFANKKAFPHGKAFWQNPRQTTSGP